MAGAKGGVRDAFYKFSWVKSFQAKRKRTSTKEKKSWKNAIPSVVLGQKSAWEASMKALINEFRIFSVNFGMKGKL